MPSEAVSRAIASAIALLAATACTELIQHHAADGGAVPSVWPPDEQSTGWAPTGVTLTPYSGPAVITTPGAVLDGLDFPSCIEIAADDVTLRRSRFGNTACVTSVISIRSKGGSQGSYRGLVVEDVEIEGQGQLACGIAGGGYTARRVHLHGINCGFDLNSNEGVRVESSYVHDLVGGSAKAARSNGSAHVVLRENNFEEPTLGGYAIFLVGDWGVVDDVLIEHNLLNGGSYSLVAGSNSSKPYPVATRVRVVSNRFGRKFRATGGAFGAVTDFAAQAEGSSWMDNSWLDTGAPLPSP